jgi:hypothetical protein
MIQVFIRVGEQVQFASEPGRLHVQCILTSQAGLATALRQWCPYNCMVEEM